MDVQSGGQPSVYSQSVDGGSVMSSAISLSVDADRLSLGNKSLGLKSEGGQSLGIVTEEGGSSDGSEEGE